MADNDARRIARWLHAYELGMLTEAEEDEFEQLLIDDPSLLREMQETEEVARIIRQHPRARSLVSGIVDQSRSVPGRASVPRHFTFRGSWRWLRFWPAPLVAAAGLLLLLVLGDWRIEFHSGSEAVSAENRLLITYFDDPAETTDPGSTGKIITSLLIADLTESRYLQVVSSDWLAELLERRAAGRGPEESAPFSAASLGRESGASWVLTGSVLQTEPYLVLSAQLVEPASGAVIAARTVAAGPGGDVFSAVDSLSLIVRRCLRLSDDFEEESIPSIADLTTHSSAAYWHYLRGVASWQQVHIEDARRNFEKAVELDSAFVMAHYHLARLGSAASLAKSLAYVSSAGHRDQILIRVEYAAQTGRWRSAIATLEDAVARYPGDRELNFNLAWYYQYDGQYQQAVDQCRRTLAIDRLYGQAYNQLAYSYVALGEFDSAIAAIDGYIAVAPGEVNPYDSRAEILGMHGLVDSAIQTYKQALALEPDFRPSREHLGSLYYLTRQYDLAEREFTVLATAEQPEIQARGRFFLSLLPVARGHFNEALRVLGTYSAADSAVRDTQGVRPWIAAKSLLQAWILADLGDYDGARDAFTRYQSHVTEDYGETRYTDQQHFEVELLAKCGALEEAEAVARDLLEHLVKIGYSLDSYWYAIGWLRLAEGRPSEAVTAFERAAETAEVFYVGYMLAYSYLEAGRPADAVTRFERLLSSYTNDRAAAAIWNIKVHYFLGRAYEESGRNQDAIAQYELFLTLWDDADSGIKEIAQARERLAQLKLES